MIDRKYKVDSDSDDSDDGKEKEPRLMNPCKEVCNDLSELFEKQIFTDVTVRLMDDKELKGHKIILSCKFHNWLYKFLILLKIAFSRPLNGVR
jgi:hypothetical protein